MWFAVEFKSEFIFPIAVNASSVFWSCMSNWFLIAAISYKEIRFIEFTLGDAGEGGLGGSGQTRQTPSRSYQLPFCGGCTKQFQISWLFLIWSLLSYGKFIFHFFFVISAKKVMSNKFFALTKNDFFHENGQKHVLPFFVSIM